MAQAAAQGRSILVVEDHPVNRLIARKLLEKRGYTVTLAEDGHEGVEAWKSAGPTIDVILMDIQMPGMDGIQATRLIRQMEASSPARIPIVAFTAHAFDSDRERCLSAGMDDYLAKPVSSELLYATLDRVLAARASG
jgi:CheY-like chemotaxis protein